MCGGGGGVIVSAAQAHFGAVNIYYRYPSSSVVIIPFEIVITSTYIMDITI